MTISNTTINNNTASSSGGGIHNLGAANLVNTIVSGNTALTGPDCTGALTSLGHNLIGDTTGCGFTGVVGDQTGVDPLLGPLQNNGGPTWTHALNPGSPAIDAGDDTVTPSTDQRGVPRPQGSASDIGAYERGPDCRGQASTIVGTSAGETITGTPGRDVIVAKGGNDIVYALAGNDLVCAGRGRDVVFGGKGRDQLFGGPGKDTLRGQGGNDKLFGNRGNDRLFGQRGNDELSGGPGTDICNQGPGVGFLRANCEIVPDGP